MKILGDILGKRVTITTCHILSMEPKFIGYMFHHSFSALMQIKETGLETSVFKSNITLYYTLVLSSEFPEH